MYRTLVPIRHYTTCIRERETPPWLEFLPRRGTCPDIAHKTKATGETLLRSFHDI